jgi:hypothetical protein
MKQLIFSGWHLVRWLRLGLGLLLITGGIVKADIVAGVLGGLLAFQALLNLGCAGGSCAGGNCAVDYTTKNNASARPSGDTEK